MASANATNIYMIETKAATYISKKPPVGVLITDGVNCHRETKKAFEMAGGDAQFVHMNDLREGDAKLDNFEIIALPGGFSYGDHLGSGKVWANELSVYLPDQLTDFVHQKNGLVLGVCNGFQVLVQSGLLPFGKIGDKQTTLRNNASGNFQCEWVRLKMEDQAACVFLQESDQLLQLPIAHGEGRFSAPADTVNQMEAQNQIVFRYCDISGDVAPTDSPFNPNGSVNGIAGITDPTGHILGLMPHPERFVRAMQHPNYRRDPAMQPQGLQLFEKMVQYVGGGQL